MLFLAVFCGFLAEYQLEHKIERDRESVYMQNLVDDLKNDTAVYSAYARNNSIIFNLIDTLIYLIKRPERRLYIGKLIYAARMITANWRQINPTERTYEQMKSSGHLRLIRNRRISDSVSQYYNSLKQLSNINEVCLLWVSDYVKAMGKIFDGEMLLKIFKEGEAQTYDPSVLLTEDSRTLNELITSAQYFYGALKLAQVNVKQRSLSANNLAELIKKEYHLK